MPEAETLTPEQATAAIDAKMADREFVKTYSNKYSDGHTDAQAEMTRLHALAQPEDKPPERIAPSLQQQQPDAADDDGADDRDADGSDNDELAQAKAEIDQLLGENAEERITEARAWLGERGLAAVHTAGFGNDPQVVAELTELSERDRASDGQLGAALGDYLSRGIAGGAAALERSTLDEDREFQKVLFDRGHPRHVSAQARLTALGILENPSPWMRQTVEAMYAK